MGRYEYFDFWVANVPSARSYELLGLAVQEAKHVKSIIILLMQWYYFSSRFRAVEQ